VREMSRLVNWGHWATAAFFAALGASLLWSAATGIPRLLRENPREIAYYFVTGAAIWVPTLFCAWGIFKWRRWARGLGIVLSALNLVLFGVVILVDPPIVREVNYGWVEIVDAICSGLILAWLFVPAVRFEYSQRNQIA
jgi:hypothetical protein